MPYYPFMQQQQPYMGYPAQPPAPAPAQSGGITWVQGEAGAKSYLVAPGSTVLLMDSENQRFFIKGADASGMPMPLRVFDYSEVTQGAAPVAQSTTEYIRRDEFDQLKALVEGLKGGAEHAESSV